MKKKEAETASFLLIFVRKHDRINHLYYQTEIMI